MRKMRRGEILPILALAATLAVNLSSGAQFTGCTMDPENEKDNVVGERESLTLRCNSGDGGKVS